MNSENNRPVKEEKNLHETPLSEQNAPESSDKGVVSAESVGLKGVVTEVLGEKKEISSGSGQKKSGATYVPVSGAKISKELFHAELLKSIPAQDLMIKQIETEIRNEIKYLHKKAIKMLRSPKKFNFFEMSNIMKKIRELKGILLTLVKSSYDKLKTLWLRYVKGSM